jgi:hypothetical protein
MLSVPTVPLFWFFGAKKSKKVCVLVKKDSRFEWKSKASEFCTLFNQTENVRLSGAVLFALKDEKRYNFDYGDAVFQVQISKMVAPETIWNGAAK